MEIEDWNLALVIALCAVVWMKIFADYRKKMMRVLPTVDQVAHRKQEFGNKIAQAENLAREITVGIDEMREQIEDLREQAPEIAGRAQRAGHDLYPGRPAQDGDRPVRAR